MAEGDLDRMCKREIGAGAGAEEASWSWEKLPEELQRKVLTYLPLQALFQARCVSKSWRDVILCREFAAMYDAMHSSDPPNPALFNITSSSSSVDRAPCRIEWSPFDCTQTKWKKRTSLALSGSQPGRWARDGEYESVYSVAGLVVFRFWKQRVHSWVVWNPLTNKWTQLPPCKNKTLKSASVFVHAFVADEGSKRYKILMAHNSAGVLGHYTDAKMVTELYDSATGAWAQCESTLQQPLCPHTTDRSKTHLPGVLSNGVIYFLSRYAEHVGVVRPTVLLSYHIDSGRWQEAVTLDACKMIFEWDGRLMAVLVHPRVRTYWEGDSEENSGDEDGFAVVREDWLICEWDLGAKTWVDAGIKVPGRIYAVDLRSMDVTKAEFVASGNYLVLAGFVENYGSFRLSVYENAEQSWRCSPSWFLNNFDDGDRVGDVLLQFKPRLD